jgi:cytochrome c-type biogenesis protein
MNEFDLTAWWAPLLAFAAGIVAFASPCVLPLVPGYLSFVTAAGHQPESAPSSSTPRARPAIVAMLLFVAGFSVVFTSLGAFAGALVPIVRSTTGQRVAGVVVLAVGVFLLLYAFRAGSASLYGESRPLIGRVQPGGGAAFPLGMAFAAGWTPCIGPGAGGYACARHGAVRPGEKRALAVLVLDGPGSPVRPRRPRRRRAHAPARIPPPALPHDRRSLRLGVGRDRAAARDRRLGPAHLAGPAPRELVRAPDLRPTPAPGESPGPPERP